jgi:hypothetical protein
MTQVELQRWLVHHAEQIAEQVTVLLHDFPQDEEGIPIHDGSDLSDAIKTLMSIESGLNRVAFKIAREGIR